jgi:L-ribulose-5-phosphate 3-epimerase
MRVSRNLIGFMQGRLCDCVDGKIQAFPWKTWKSEFLSAKEINMNVMEWTLDQRRLYRNPLMTSKGQEIIRKLSVKYNISIPSLTGDCFMQSPFWKIDTLLCEDLQADFIAICKACAALGIQMIVMPLVDNGRLETQKQEKVFLEFMLKHHSFFIHNKIKVIFESDYDPEKLMRFINYFPCDCFGINYDSGNSAAFGFVPSEEFDAYGSRVLNIHIKDRVLGGETVPLGKGNVDFDDLFSRVFRQKYQGNFILQTARVSDGNHAKVLSEYRDLILKYMRQYVLGA